MTIPPSSPQQALGLPAPFSARSLSPTGAHGHGNKEAQEIQVRSWVRRRAGDTHAASQVTPLSKACPDTGEQGGTPRQGLGLTGLRARPSWGYTGPGDSGGEAGLGWCWILWRCFSSLGSFASWFKEDW